VPADEPDDVVVTAVQLAVSTDGSVPTGVPVALYITFVLTLEYTVEPVAQVPADHVGIIFGVTCAVLDVLDMFYLVRSAAINSNPQLINRTFLYTVPL
jgi:hypothetical protein